MSTRRKKKRLFSIFIYTAGSPATVCACVEGCTSMTDACGFLACQSRDNSKHHRIVIEGITWMTARKRPSIRVFLCAFWQWVAYVCAHAHTHSSIEGVWQRRQLPTVLFLHALFAITVISRATASLSDFYEHTCEDYWDLWTHCWECESVWEQEKKKKQWGRERSKMLIWCGKRPNINKQSLAECRMW